MCIKILSILKKKKSISFYEKKKKKRKRKRKRKRNQQLIWKFKTKINFFKNNIQTHCLTISQKRRLSANSKGPFGYNLFLLKLKTENWKYCIKIISKYMNSTVGLIFNIFLVCEQWWIVHKQWFLSLRKAKTREGKKKKKKKRKTQNTKRRRNNSYPNYT